MYIAVSGPSPFSTEYSDAPQVKKKGDKQNHVGMHCLVHAILCRAMLNTFIVIVYLRNQMLGSHSLSSPLTVSFYKYTAQISWFLLCLPTSQVLFLLSDLTQR